MLDPIEEEAYIINEKEDQSLLSIRHDCESSTIRIRKLSHQLYSDPESEEGEREEEEIVIQPLNDHHNVKQQSSSLRKLNVHFSPKVGDTVKIHYEAFLYNRNHNHNHDSANTTRSSRLLPFDSSRKRDLPFCFVVGKGDVVEGLDLALQQMTLGQMAEVTIPYMYAFGEGGYLPHVPAKSTVMFRVELLDFTHGDVTNRSWTLV